MANASNEISKIENNFGLSRHCYILFDIYIKIKIKML